MNPFITSYNFSQFTADDLEVNQLVEVKYGHGKTTYQAKIVQIEPEDKTVWVHYLGWNNRYLIGLLVLTILELL